MDEKRKIVEEETTEGEKDSRFKHIIPLSPLTDSSHKQEERDFMSDCSPDICGVDW